MSREVSSYTLITLSCLAGFFLFQFSGIVHANDGNTVTAIDPIAVLNRRIAEKPDDTDIRFERARLLESRGQNGAASEDYRRLMEQQPQMPEPYNNLAGILAKQGKLGQAIKLLEHGIATNSIYQTMHVNLSSIFREMARRAYRQALSEPTTANGSADVDEHFAFELKALHNLSLRDEHRETRVNSSQPAKIIIMRTSPAITSATGDQTNEVTVDSQTEAGNSLGGSSSEEIESTKIASHKE